MASNAPRGVDDVVAARDALIDSFGGQPFTYAQAWGCVRRLNTLTDSRFRQHWGRWKGEGMLTTRECPNDHVRFDPVWVKQRLKRELPARG